MRGLLLSAAVALAVVGVAVWFIPYGAEIARIILVAVCAIVLIICIAIAARLPKPTIAKMYSAEKQLLVEIKELIVDKRGLGAKSVMLGAMQKTVYVRPDELWNLVSLIKLPVILAALKTLLGPPRASEQKTN